MYKPLCPITTNDFHVNTDILYISRETNTIYINNKGGNIMDFDVEKIKNYYNELVAKKDEAVVVALTTKDEKVKEAFENAKAEIEERVVAEIIAEAEAPYLHDIELCEKFIVVEEVAETDEAVNLGE